MPSDKTTQPLRPKPTPETKTSLGRRELLKALLATGGAVTAKLTMPDEWYNPIVDVGTLPAHAQTSITATSNAPIFTSTAVINGVAGTAYNYNISTSDTDIGDTLTITAPTLPSWLTLTDNGNGTATLSGMPTNSNAGSNNVVLQVQDSTGLTAIQSFTISIATTNAPIFTSTAVINGVAGTAYNYNISTSDTDVGDTLTITAPTLPSWLTLTDNGNGTATLSGMPTNSNAGSNNVVLQVQDSTGLTAIQSFTISIANVLAYVANLSSNNVSVVDTSNDTVIATVPVGSAPFGVAVTPDGSRVYVTNLSSDNVSIIDTSSHTAITTIPVGNAPEGVAVTPDGSRVYVANFSSNNVSVIDTSSDTVITTIPVGVAPNGVAVTPDGSKVYVANLLTGVSVIDASSDTVIATISAGSIPNRVAVTPDGSKVYVTNRNSDNVSVIDTSSDTVITTVPVGSSPNGVAVTPDGSKVYVANGGGNISVIDTSSDTVTATITVGSANSVAVTPDGSKAYVTHGLGSTISVIDTSSDTVTTIVPVGTQPYGIGIIN